MAVKGYLVGFQASSGYYILLKARRNGSIDTSWGVGGYWGMTIGAYQTSIVRNILPLADGRVLVAHNNFPYDGVAGHGLAVCTMLLPDGTIDTSWATNGQYLTPYGVTGIDQCRAMLQDSLGNFYLFGGVNDTGPTYVKLDASGALVWQGPSGYGKLRVFYDAVWANALQTRIIGVGGYSTLRDTGPPDSGYVYGNMMAINPATGALDATWTGNLWPGWSLFGAPGASLNHVVLLSDGGFVVMKNETATLTKVLADGSAKDAAWGTAGDLAIGAITMNPQILRIAQDGDVLYTWTQNAGPVDTLTKIGDDGSVIDHVDVAVPSAGSYNTVQIFNSELLVGTVGAPNATHDVEHWTQALAYVRGFDVAISSYIFYIAAEAASGPRQLIIGKRRTGHPMFAKHTACRNVYG